MKRIFLIIIFNTLCYLAMSQSKYEVRAVWLTNIYGLDWPSHKAESPQLMQKQKQELLQILDELQKANINTVLFQARARGDVFYQSKYEPFSAVLTGKINKHPGYDPLAFAIEECHKRGMECHAWIVSIPAGTEKQIRLLKSNSVPVIHPELCFRHNGQYYLNPGNPGARHYLTALVDEVVEHYDIDGIHLDYLRYPEHVATYVDRGYFKRYGKGRSLADWRRDNITSILRDVYFHVKRQKPWVKVSVAPIGKKDDTSRYSSLGWNAFHMVYQDVDQWINEGIIDQIYPMIYFKDEHFYPFAADWIEGCGQRQVIPGLGVYFLDIPEKKWSTDDLERQINFLRAYPFAGISLYRTEYIIKDTKHFTSILKERYYEHPALQPPMTWLDSIAPKLGGQLRLLKTDDFEWKLSWNKATDNDKVNEPVYTIYASEKYPVDTNNPKHILATKYKSNSYIYSPVLSWMQFYHFAVTATDRYGNESLPIQVSIP